MPLEWMILGLVIAGAVVSLLLGMLVFLAWRIDRRNQRSDTRDGF